MSLEKKAVKLFLRKNIEILEEAEKGDASTFSQIDETIEKANKSFTDGTEALVKNEFDSKLKDYETLVGDKDSLFKDIFKLAKDDYVAPVKENGEKIRPYLSRSQEAFGQLEKEVEAVKRTMNRFSQLDSLYSKEEEFKKIINEELEKQRTKAMRTTKQEILDGIKVKLQLPQRFLVQLVDKVVKEREDKGDYERFNGTLSPVIEYKGKKIKAGRLYEDMKQLKDRGVPFGRRREDIEASICSDYNTFFEWIKSMEIDYDMEVNNTGKAIFGFNRKMRKGLKY